MAANSMVDGEAIARKRGPHPLALAYFGVFAAVLLVFAAVAYFGRASDGDPVVTLELHGAAPRPVKRAGSGWLLPRRTSPCRCARP